MRNRRADSVRPIISAISAYGLPRAVQVDNGMPFVSTRAPGGLTALSAWWMSLGIRLVRGRLGHPEDNGGHDRMHVDTRYELEDVAAGVFEAQQVACDRSTSENAARSVTLIADYWTDVSVTADAAATTAKRGHAQAAGAEAVAPAGHGRA